MPFFDPSLFATATAAVATSARGKNARAASYWSQRSYGGQGAVTEQSAYEYCPSLMWPVDPEVQAQRDQEHKKNIAVHNLLKAHDYFDNKQGFITLSDEGCPFPVGFKIGTPADDVAKGIYWYQGYNNSPSWCWGPTDHDVRSVSDCNMSKIAWLDFFAHNTIETAIKDETLRAQVSMCCYSSALRFGSNAVHSVAESFPNVARRNWLGILSLCLDYQSGLSGGLSVDDPSIQAFSSLLTSKLNQLTDNSLNTLKGMVGMPKSK